MKPITKVSVIFAALCLFAAFKSPAPTTIYVGTNGVSATTNWSTAANFVDVTSHNPESPANNAADFNYNTAVAGQGVVTVNVDGIYPGQGGSGIYVGNPQAWGMFFGQTNGCHTVFVQPGITWCLTAASSTPGGGNLVIAPQNTNTGSSSAGNSPTIAYTNYTTITGIGGTFIANCGVVRVEGQSGVVGNHYGILDMSGLGTFIYTNTSAASQNLYVAGNGSTRSHALMYLAHTNVITMTGGAIQIGNLTSTSSNSQPVGLYLGQSNFISSGTGANGLLIGGIGVSNAFMRFNPAFVGGPTMPSAYITAPSGNQSATICSAAGGSIGGSAACDLTGGNVTWIGNSLTLGTSGTNSLNTTANGVLTFDNGTVSFNTITVGNQSVTAGAVGVGTINVGTNATLQAAGKITLGAVTGTLTAGTAGTININTNGILAASTITNGGGGSTINMTNANWQVALSSTGVTNMTVGNFSAAGTTNIINITAITPFLGGSPPLRFHLIAASTITGASTLGLLLPTSIDPGHPYQGYLDSTTTPGLVDLVLTNAPASARSLTWSGLNAGVPDGDWDVAATADWLANAVATTYNQFDLATFNDITSPAQTNINLTNTITPYSITVSNTASLYTIAGSGNLSGATGLTKQGTGTLVLDNTGAPNDFTGGVTISSGILQVGTNDTGGNLPASGVISNNAGLVVARTDAVTIGNVIAGSGIVVEAGPGGTLTLTGANTFTNSVFATNGSTLQLGSSTGVGAGSGSVVIASGSTLDVKGFSSVKSVVVSGTGVGGNGAILDSGGNVLDTAGGISSNITLTADTTITFPAAGHRMDLVPRPGGGHLNTGGNGYNLTFQTADSSASTYNEIWDLVSDAKLADVTLLSGWYGLCGTTQFGDTTKSLILSSGSVIQFYNDGANNVQLQKPIIMNDGATIWNNGGASTLGPINFAGSSYCIFKVSGASLTLTDTLSGAGIMYVTGGNGTSPLYITGNSPSFSGGVLLYTGSLILNGTIGSGIESVFSTAVEGTGTANGAVTVGGNLLAGTAGVAGTLTMGSGGANGLTLLPGVSITNDCGATTNIGGAENDLFVVNGDLTLNNNAIYINPIGASLATTGEYTLLTYSGNLIGSFAGVSLVAPSRYILTLDTNTPHEIKLMVSGAGGGGPASLVWNNAGASGEWDVQGSQNWSNSTAQVSPDFFFTQDSVLFDDSIATSATPTTAIDIASGQVIIAGGITNDSTTNYTISGAGKISGSSGITKMGTSTLTINTTNDFTGNVSVQGGTLVAGSTGAIGGTNATLTITNGGTVDMNGFAVGNSSYVISGAGVAGNGALINNGATIFTSATRPITNMTLTGNVTFGGPDRWDLGTRAGLNLGGTLRTGGNNYKVTLIGNPTTGPNSTYWEWENLNVDANLGDIEIVAGELGVLTSALGNPANTVIIDSGGKMTVWGGSGYAKNFDVKTNGTLYVRRDGPNFNMNLTLEDGASFGSADNIKTNFGTISLPGGMATVSNITATCTLAGVISGAGGINLASGNSPVVLTATNTYTGSTLITGSGATLSLAGNGSISSSTNITIASGATLNANGRSDSALTLASGQTLIGDGAIVGGLVAGPGSTVSPGTAGIGALSISIGASLQGTTAMDLGSGTNDVINTPTILYGGMLSLSFTPGSLAAGNTFKLFNASTYNGGSFSVAPASPGPGLAWDTSALTNSGTLGVVAVVTPVIGGITISGTNLTITGTGTVDSTYRVLTSTNLVSVTNNAYWIQIYSGSINGAGNFTTTGLGFNPADTQRYFTIVTP